MPPSEETKVEMTGTPVKPARTPSASTNLSVEQQEPPVDAAIISEEDKLDRINFLDVFSPQMQAFHLAWISFMTAFIAWFSIAPLMPVIKKALHLKKQQIMYANLASVSTTIVARIAFGPLCDRFGPKRTMAVVLLLGSIPVFCVGQIQTWQQLVAVRAAIGFLGASFVMSQAWASNMFRFNIVGTANAFVGGWGNLGGGVTQPMMADIYQDLLDSGLTKDQAWRRSFYVPAVLLVVVAAAVYFLGQDTPKGDIKDLRRKQAEAGVAQVSTAKASMWLALSQLPTYILAIQYAASFGVELTVFNMAATYFHETYKISVVRAGNIALLSGITNIFARALGGFLSDFACRELGMRGRLVMQWLLVLFEGVLLVWFSHAPNFHMSTALLLAFSIFVQAANGSCFAIVPYVSPYKGSVSGIVGAGGNIGAMVFSLLFIFGKFASTAQGYRLMGWAVLVASFTIFFIRASDLKEYGKQQQKQLVDATVHDEEEGVAKAVHFDRI